MPYNDSPWHRKNCPSEDSSVEEEIEEEIEEELLEEIEEGIEEGIEEKILEEIEEKIEEEIEEEIEERIEDKILEEGQEFANKVEEEVEEDQEYVYSTDEDFEDSLDLNDEEKSEINEIANFDKSNRENYSDTSSDEVRIQFSGTHVYTYTRENCKKANTQRFSFFTKVFQKNKYQNSKSSLMQLITAYLFTPIDAELTPLLFS